MDGITQLQGGQALRVVPQPGRVEPAQPGEGDREVDQRRPDTQAPAPTLAPESLEGRDLADPFEQRRNDELSALSEGLATAPEVAEEVGLRALPQTAVELELTATESAEAGQSPAEPRPLSRYQSVPRNRSNQAAEPGLSLQNPEAALAQEDQVRPEPSAVAPDAERAVLEGLSEARVREGGAELAGAALSAVGEQFAAQTDDGALRSVPPVENPRLDAGADDGVESPETEELEATLAAPEDLEELDQEPRQDETREA